LGSLDKKAEKSTCSLALTSTSSPSFSLHASEIAYYNSWVLDSGASDHMTPFSHVFITYNPCASSRKIMMANGSLTIVAGLGDVLLNKHLTLKNVLHVPKLFTSLISIQKLIEDTNCSVIFHSNVYELQEPGKKRMIGLAKARAGLYYLAKPSGQVNKEGTPLVSYLA